jgi:hypothetical protein
MQAARTSSNLRIIGMISTFEHFQKEKIQRLAMIEGIFDRA